MSGLFYIFISPILLSISIPLTIFAAFTTTLAFSTLFFRVLIVYAELAAAVIQDHIYSTTPSKIIFPSSRPILKDKSGRRKSRRGSAASESSNGTNTSKTPRSSGLSVYSGEGPARDFEGVGGWRIPGPDGEDERWTNMNSRLELPATMDRLHRNHHRSRTSGSLTSYRLPLKSPADPQTQSLHHRSQSPEEYFANRTPSKSTSALDTANIGRGLLRHKVSSSSSASSQGSMRTSQLTLSNT